MIRVGDVVTIYEQPAERRHPEGVARLAEFLDHGQDGFTFWRVEFLARPGVPYLRSVCGEATDAEPTWNRGRSRAKAGAAR